MIAFDFDKALMQEHFNEKYVESEIYPKSTFTGKIENWDLLNTKQEGVFNVKSSGVIEIHGVKKEIVADGILEILNQKVNIKSSFSIKIEEFNIQIPRIVRENIAEEVVIDVDVQLIKHN